MRTRARSATPPGSRCASEGHPAVAELELAWRSPTYYHCNFTALPGFDGRGGVERGTARDGLRRPDAAPGDGPRGRQALAAGRQERLRDVDRGDAGAGLPRTDRRRCEAGTLELGAGLEVLVSASLATLRAGDLLDVVLHSRSAPSSCPPGHVSRDMRSIDERREDGAYVVTLRGRRRRAAPLAGGPALDSPTFPNSELRRLACPGTAGGGSRCRPRPTRRACRAESRRATTGRSPAATASGPTSSPAQRPRRTRPVGRDPRRPLGGRRGLCDRTSNAASRR